MRHKVRLFKSLEGDLQSLEEQINDWIAESGAQVISITGNIAPQSLARGSDELSGGLSSFFSSDVLIIVFYKG